MRWSKIQMQRRPVGRQRKAAAACPCGRRHSSVSAPWSVPGSSRCWALPARWPARLSGSRSSSLARSPSCRATRSRSSEPGTPPPAGSWSTSSEDGVTGTSPAYSPGCCSRSTRSSPRWSRCRSEATPAPPSLTTADWTKLFAVLVLLVMAGLNILGSQAVARAQTVVVIVVIGILVVFSVATLSQPGHRPAGVLGLPLVGTDRVQRGADLLRLPRLRRHHLHRQGPRGPPAPAPQGHLPRARRSQRSCTSRSPSVSSGR